MQFFPNYLITLSVHIDYMHLYMYIYKICTVCISSSFQSLTRYRRTNKEEEKINLRLPHFHNSPRTILRSEESDQLGLIVVKTSTMRVTIPLDLSMCPFIPLPRFFHSPPAPSLLTHSLVLFPQRSAYVSHDVFSLYKLHRLHCVS